MIAEPIIIRPEDLSTKDVGLFSEQIIHSMIAYDQLDVIGLSTAIFLTCSSVNISTSIANVHVNATSLDYIDIPVVGKFEGIFFVLGREPKVDWKSQSEKFDKTMKLSIDPTGQLIVISRRQEPARMITMCLWKLSKFDRLKIIAAGTAINNAVYVALQVARGGIAKEPVAISLVALSTVPSREGILPKPVTGIEIYLEKGKETVYDNRHLRVLERIKTGTRAPFR